MVGVLSIQGLDMESRARGEGEGAEPLLEQFGVHLAEFGRANATFHTRNGRFDRSMATRSGFRPWDERGAVAADAAAVAEGFGHRGADDDAVSSVV